MGKKFADCWLVRFLPLWRSEGETSRDTMDETIPDYEQFERRQLATDRDTGPNPLCIDESLAHDLVENLRAEGVVEVVPVEQLLAHSPSGEVFESNQALAYFHAGWEAASE